MYSPVVKRDATTTGGQWLANGLSAENGMSNGRSPVWHAIAKAFAPAMANAFCANRKMHHVSVRVKLAASVV